MAALFAIGPAPAVAADDPLERARLLYNQRQYDDAVRAAEQARLIPARADAADLVPHAPISNSSARRGVRRSYPRATPAASIREARRASAEHVVGLGRPCSSRERSALPPPCSTPR